MSENSSRKPLGNLLPDDNTNIESTNGNPLINGHERRPLVTSNAVRTGTLPSFSSNDISNAIAKQAQALQQAAALLQQHNDQPMVMAKKSNVIQPSSKNNAQTTSGMVQLNVVNENGIVTPIEVNAAVAAFVAAQKHQNQRLEGSSSGNLNPTANGITNVVTSVGSSLKQNDLGSKITKSLPSSNSASISTVSNV